MRGRIVTRWASIAASVMLLVTPAVRAEDAELDALKKAVEQMQKTINTLNQKIETLEQERQQEKAAAAAAPKEKAMTPAEAAVALAPPAEKPISPEVQSASEALETVLTSQGIGPQAPVDPALRGFVRIPNTGVMLRFNAKPRVDFTYDTGNAGDDNRFITAKIPVSGDPNKGGGPVFNANGKGSQLVVDVRAPDVAGSPRFYYQNDFFGSGVGRVQLSHPAPVRKHLQRHRRPDLQSLRRPRHLAGHGGLRRSELDDLRALPAGALQDSVGLRVGAQRRTDAA